MTSVQAGQSPRYARFRAVFLVSVAVALELTGLAKVFSAGGGARILSTPDPVLLLSTRQVLLFAAGLEIAAATYLLTNHRSRRKLLAVSWMAFVFIAYRVFAWHLARGTPCPCLGTVTSNLGIDQRWADLLLRAALAYMAFGSGFFLLCDVLARRRLSLGRAQTQATLAECSARSP